MKFIYSSRTGNTEAFIKKLDIDAMKITNENEIISEPFILFTYTDGHGIVPKVVDKFLQKNKENIKGVIATGNKDRHADTFCFAGNIISKEYNVPCLYKVHSQGNEEDIQALQDIIKNIIE